LDAKALWCVSNIVGEAEMKEVSLINTDATVDRIMSLCREGDVEHMRLAAWAASNVFRRMNVAHHERLRRYVPDMIRLLDHVDDEVIEWGLIALHCANRVLDADAWHEELIYLGLVPRVITLLQKPLALAKHALAVAGSLCSGSDTHCQTIIDAQLLPKMLILIKRCSNDESTAATDVRKAACWTLCNISAGLPSQRQMVMKSGLVPILLEMLRNRSPNEFKTRLEAAWAVSYLITLGDESDVQFFHQSGTLAELRSVIGRGIDQSYKSMHTSLITAIDILSRQSANLHTNQLMQPE
jgi:hypothetical protein